MRRLSDPEIAAFRHLVAGDGPAPDLDSADWDLVLEAAHGHRLTSLLHERLSRSTLKTPRSTRLRLNRAFHIEMARAVVRLHHVGEIDTAASRSGLRVCLLKGAAFAAILYPNPAMRPMADIDVLVRAEELSRWASELDELGFAHHNSSDHAACFRNERTGVFIELHHSLTSCGSFLGLDSNVLFERSRAVPGLDAVSTMGLEDHLLHLCLHASFQHGFRQAAVNAWDSRLIVAHQDFEPNVFLERARHPRLARWVFGGLYLSDTAFPSPGLSTLAEQLLDLVPSRLQRKLASIDASQTLSPGPDASARPPMRRLLWAGDAKTATALLFEVLEPKSSDKRGRPASKAARALQLLWNHYLRAAPLALMKHLQAFVRQTPASLGEVRDV